MSFNGIEHNDRLIERLKNTIINGHLSHAYIFEGDSATDKLLFANSFIKAILCKEKPGEGCDCCRTCLRTEHGNNEDVYYVQGQGKNRSTKDEAIEYLQERLKIKPNGERNIAVIQVADTMTVRAQNRLLKTLEEPHFGTVIILLSENTENLLPTIRSRCIKLHIEHFGGGEAFPMEEKATRFIDSITERRPFYQLKGEIEDIAGEEEATGNFLDSLENVYRQLLLGKGKNSGLYKKEDIYYAVDIIEETRRNIQRGVAKNYALKRMIVKIGG